MRPSVLLVTLLALLCGCDPPEEDGPESSLSLVSFLQGGKTIAAVSLRTGKRRILASVADPEKWVRVSGFGGLAPVESGRWAVDLCRLEGNPPCALYFIELKNGKASYWREGAAVYPTTPGGPLLVYSEHEGLTKPFLVWSGAEKREDVLLFDELFSLTRRPVVVSSDTIVLDAANEFSALTVSIDTGATGQWPNGDGCRPVAWRSKTQQLVCEAGPSYFFYLDRTGRRSDVHKRVAQIDFVIDYVADIDALIGVRTVLEWFPLGERTDLVVVDLASGAMWEIEKDVRIDVSRSMLLALPQEEMVQQGADDTR